MDESKPLIELIKLILVKQLNLKRKPETISADTLLFTIGPDSPHYQKDLDSLNLDSIDSLEIIIALEKEFGINVTDEELKEPEKIFRNVGALTDFVKSKLDKK